MPADQCLAVRERQPDDAERTRAKFREHMKAQTGHTCGAPGVLVSDSGVGMDASAAAEKAGLGLLNIRERARLVRGKAGIRSVPGEGTSVTVEVPDA
jgi:nitrate/nitrite-specific signal transduction histidine kinase